MPHTAQIPDFLSAADIASRLGCSARTVRRRMASGVLPCAPRLSSRQRYCAETSELRARLDELKAKRASNDTEDELD